MISYLDFRNDVINNKTTCFDFTSELIEKIKKNKYLNSFISNQFDQALESAKLSDERFQNNTQRSLEGMIIAIKDNISTKDVKTTCASKMLENYSPLFDATAVEKLKNDGAIIIGKTNLDEFAMGSSSETSFYGNTLNNLNNDYVPGGSSGGSAVAVSAGLCHVSLGSDTGGSVRQPASFTGTFGFKPTYGTISRYGLIAFASSFDQIGLFASNSDDIALVLDSISGHDKKDATTTNDKPFNSFKKINIDSNNKKIGIISGKELEHLEPEVLELYDKSVKKLRDSGAEIIEIDFPYAELWIPIYYILTTAEASSNLSRFDGIRFGFRANEVENENFVTTTRSEGFGEEVKRRIMLGTYVLSAGFTDNYYMKAQKARRKIFENYKKIFSEVDLIFMPTTPSAAFKIDSQINNPIAMYMSDYYTTSANIAGIPAISIPVAKNKEGLPIGMQLQTNNFDDENLLRYSKYYHKILSE